MITVHTILRHYHPVVTGVGERLRRYSPGLRDRGVELVIETGLDADTATPSSDSDPLVHRHPTGNTSGLEIDLDVLRGALRRIEHNQSSVLWQATTGSTPFLRALRAAKHRTKAKALYLGTMVEPRLSEMPMIQRVKRAASDWLFRNTYDHFIASGSTMAEIFRQRGIPSQKISIIPSGMDTQRFHPVSADEKLHLRSRLGFPPKARIVLFVGGIVPRKGVLELLLAWRQHILNSPQRDDLIVLIGSSKRPTFVSNAQKQDLSRYQCEIDDVTAKIAPENFRHVESLDEIETAYQAADLFIFPSKKEGMPNAVMEAMACGLPVLTSRFIGFPKTKFGDEGSEYELLPSSTYEIAAKIGSLLNSTERRIELGSNARQWTKNHLDLQVTLDRYADVYHHLANQ